MQICKIWSENKRIVWGINKGEAQKIIILPFQRFQGLKVYPMNQNPFLYLSDVFSVIIWLKNISKAAPLPSQNFVLANLNLVPRVYSAFKMAAEIRPWHTPLWYPRWLFWRYRHSYISRDWPKLSSLKNDPLVQLYLLFPRLFPLQLKQNCRRFNIPRV